MDIFKDTTGVSEVYFQVGDINFKQIEKEIKEHKDISEDMSVKVDAKNT